MQILKVFAISRNLDADLILPWLREIHRDEICFWWWFFSAKWTNCRVHHCNLQYAFTLFLLDIWEAVIYTTKIVFMCYAICMWEYVQRLADRRLQLWIKVQKLNYCMFEDTACVSFGCIIQYIIFLLGVVAIGTQWEGGNCHPAARPLVSWYLYQIDVVRAAPNSFSVLVNKIVPTYDGQLQGRWYLGIYTRLML